MKLEAAQISIQHDWFLVLREATSSFWVSCTKKGTKTKYGEVKHANKSSDRELIATDGFQVELVKSGVLMVTCEEYDCTTYFFAPANAFENIYNKPTTCMDISPEGGLAVSSADDGLSVWQTKDGVTRRTLDGHITETTHCRFFPSGLVVLSGGADMRLKIWSVEDGSCPVTLTGHKGAITDTAIVEKGRNIISCSRDGSAILWDCGSASQISSLCNFDSPINCCQIATYQSQIKSEEAPKEFGTGDKMLAVGEESGLLHTIDIRSRAKVSTTNLASPINDCCFVNDRLLVAGLQNGFIKTIDVRQPGCALDEFQYGGAAVVKSLDRYSDNSVVVGRGDGSCSCVKTERTAELVTMEMTGSNCDVIYDVVSRDNSVFSTCRDKTIRKYNLALAT